MLQTEEQSSAAIICSKRSPHLLVTPLAASEWSCHFSDANDPLPGSAAFSEAQRQRADLPWHMCRASEGWARGSAFPQRKAAGLDGL